MFIRVHLDSLDITEGNSTFESVSKMQLYSVANVHGLDLKLEETSLNPYYLRDGDALLPRSILLTISLFSLIFQGD